MRRLKELTRLVWCFFALALASLPSSASACATCFGKSDSDLARGMNAGIFSLLVVVVFVLGGCAAFFVYLAKRSAMIASSSTAVPAEPSPTSK